MKKTFIDEKEVKKRNLANSDYNKLPISVSVFCDRSLSVFEVLVEYLKEEKNLKFSEIAVITNRNARTIWTVYDRAKKKRKKIPKAPLRLSKIMLPVNVLVDRRFSVLEAIVIYLKEELKYSFHEIGRLLNRNDRTVWTVYSRACKKRGGK